jgi:hypothetical protein
MERKTLFGTADGRKFYHIPVEATHIPGNLVLRSLVGDRIVVDADWASQFSLPEDEAKRMAAEEMAAFAKKAASFVAGAAAAMREAAANVTPKKPTPEQMSTIAGGLGLTEDQLKNDPNAVLSALKAAFQGITETTKSAMANDPAARESAKQRMQILAAHLEATTGTKIDLTTFPEKLREVLSNPKLEADVRAATKRLEEAAEELRASTFAPPAKIEPDEA